MSHVTVPHIVRPRQVSRHLNALAEDGSAACMTSSYLRVPGTVSLEDEGRVLQFEGRESTLSRVARIEPGQSVRVDYRYESDNLVFFTRITEPVVPGTWQLARPMMVQRLTRRSDFRRPIPESAGIRVALMTNHGFQSYQVVDLSSGGAAVRYDAREVGLWVGRRVTVWMEFADVQGVPVTAEVRHVSRRGCPPGYKQVGLRFVDPGPVVRRAIDLSLLDG